MNFVYKKDLRRHMQDKHGSVKWYCTYPGCTYKLARDGTAREESIQRHVSSWHGVQDSRQYYICR